MSNKRVEKQTWRLVTHMNEHLKATELHKKGQAAIFNKHKLPGGEFGPGLNDDLKKYRDAFAEEWGPKGWRNEEFVKRQMEQMQRPSEEEVDEMHEGDKPEITDKREIATDNEFRQRLDAQTEQRQRRTHKPKI